MSFDPTLPAEGAPLVSAVMRAQLNGLKDLIDAVVPGTITAVIFDSISAVGPADPPSASATLIGTELHLSLAIPRGFDGMAGTPGSVINGAQVDSVSSVNPTDPASASASYDGSLLHFTFGIPRGIDGTNGAPGEVSNAALDAAIGGTSSNSNGVGTLDTPFADADDEALRGKLNELIAALRRP